METKLKKRCKKLMNNAIYQKALEILRSRINVKLVNNEKHYLKWTSNKAIRPIKYLTMI